MGISGAGKTTIGKRLKEYYDSINKKNYLLDGDEVRNLFDNDLGYTNYDREMNIKRIILGAHILDRNDIIGIICNISPFEKLRVLSRKKIAGYNEIYLKKDINISMKNDVKNVYADHLGKTEVVGIDIGFDEPQKPDLVLEVDKLTEEETFEQVKQYIINKYGAEYDDSKL
jgi:adenylylsulfate kinase